MKVLYFEQWDGGHYSNYLNCLVREVSSLSTELVLAVGPTMRRTLDASGVLKGLSNVSFTGPLPAVNPGLAPRDRLASTRNLLSCLREVRPDFSMIPSADAQSTGLGLMHSVGLYSREQFGPVEGTLHYGYGFAAKEPKDRVKEWVYSQTCRHSPFSSVNFVNFAYYEFARANRLLPAERMRCVGDPVPQPVRIGRVAARHLLGLDPGHRYIGLFGSLDRRKAVPEMLAAFRAASLGSSSHLVLGGRLDAAYAQLLADDYSDMVKDGSIIVMDRFLSDRELECAYEALDVAVIAYYRFSGLASLALKAVAAGTPFIAHDFGWLRVLAGRFGVGETTDIFDVARFANSMRRSLQSAEQRKPDAAAGRLLKFHEQDNFARRMTSGLRQAVGAPPVATFDWEWVLEGVPPERRSMT